MAKIKFRRDTAATWTEVNPVLAQGEPGFEHNTGRLKIGDGVTEWDSLAYSGGTGGTGGDLTTITVPADAGPYKGIKASYGRIHSNSSSTELNLSKIVIHKPADVTTTIDSSTDSDDFRVTGLTTSDIVAMFILYGDVNGPKDVTVLKTFTEAVIDTVLLAGGVEGSFNTLVDMQTAFNTNAAALSSAAGGLDQDFQFYQTSINTTTGITTTREGSGAIFTFADGGGGYSFLSIANGGSNYLPGHKLVVLGSTLGGTDGINDAVFTVNTVDAGAITSVNLAGTSFATAPAEGWTFPGTNYQVGSGFAAALIGKNQDNTLYANFNAQGSGYVVGDVLTLLGSDLPGGLSPDNDITITITEVDVSGVPSSWIPTGTLPEIWPTNFISDGGNDQYDDGNYISTDLANQINYNGGEIVADGVGEFGTGSAYSFVYQPGIFGLLVTGNSANYVETSGGTGADGNSTADIGELYARATPERTFDNAIGYINIISNPYAGLEVNFVKTNDGSEVDILIPDDENGSGVGITRSNNQGIYNPYREGGWDSDVSPAGTLWNIDGWNDLSDVETRTYQTLYAAFGSGGLGNKIVGTECIMYLPDNDKYYTVKFSQWTQNANGGGFVYTRRELDLNNLSNGIGFADGTRLTSAEGVGRVKLTSPGGRRIEEVTGFNQVSVTERVTTNLTATASRSAVNESGIWLGSSEPLHDIIVSPQLYGIIDDASMQFSVDNNTWYNFSTISVIDNERVYGIPVPVSYNQGDSIYFRYKSGGAPVVWWDKNNLPGGAGNFRGAVIDYHAYTGESTIIGTIHIVDDDGEEYISHQEVQSGSTDGENDDLWLVQNEGQIHYRRIDGESKTLKIHWTAKVFYGSELYD